MTQQPKHCDQSCDQSTRNEHACSDPAARAAALIPEGLTVQPAPMRKLSASRRAPIAYIFANGKRQALGPWGSDLAHEKYGEYIQSLQANVAAAVEELPAPTPNSVGDLMARFSRHADGYYTKHGRITNTAKTVRVVRNLVVASGLHTYPLATLGPKWLKSFREFLAGHPQQRWSRTTINEYVATIIRACEFGVSEEIITEDLVGRMRSIKPLRKGRGITVGKRTVYMREEQGCEPVDRAMLRISRRYLSRTLRIMLDVQLITGMRPSEVCAMRPRDVKPTKRSGVRVYHVPAENNKLDHHDIERKVYLGPRAIRLLAMVTPANPNRHYFSPIRAEEERNAAKRSSRKSKRWPAHTAAARNERDHGGRKARHRDHYDRDTYRIAIFRACGEAFGRDDEGLPIAWWSPNQLRHSRASVIANRDQLQLAQMVLGHQSIQTTMRYVKVRNRNAEALAARVG